jgi:hypothetical protein
LVKAARSNIRMLTLSSTVKILMLDILFST